MGCPRSPERLVDPMWRLLGGQEPEQWSLDLSVEVLVTLSKQKGGRKTVITPGLLYPQQVTSR